MANPFDYILVYGSPTAVLADPLADTDTEMVLTALPIGWPGLGAGKKIPAFIISSALTDPYELVYVTSVGGAGDLTWQIDRSVEGSPGGTQNFDPGDYVFIVNTHASTLALSDWASLTNVPTEFPPEDHAHTATGDGGTVSYDDLTDTPTSLPPSGSAGGELTGTYPNPTVTSVHSGSAHHTNANDPSSGEKAALAGTSGTPGSGNKYVTDSDSRNSDARTPTAHATSHENGGSDVVNPTEAEISLSDVTTLNVNTSRHGFAPKAPNDATQYLDGTGAWSTPAGTGGGTDYALVIAMTGDGPPPEPLYTSDGTDYLYLPVEVA